MDIILPIFIIVQDCNRRRSEQYFILCEVIAIAILTVIEALGLWLYQGMQLRKKNILEKIRVKNFIADSSDCVKVMARADATRPATM